MNFFTAFNRILVLIIAALTIALISAHIIMDMCHTTGGIVCLVVIIAALIAQLVVIAYGRKEEE